MKFESLQAAITDFLSETKIDSMENMHEAILDGHVIPDLGDVSFLSKCTDLGYLSLNKCDIRKLPKFPALNSLERLELCDNGLHDGLEGLSHLEGLEELHLGGNKFGKFEQLKPLAKLKNLRILDLTDCPVVEADSELQVEIFKLIPSLEAFNGKDASGESVDFEDGSSDLDDYSDEDSSDEEENDGEEKDDDDEDDDDEDDDDEDDDEEGEEEEDARPKKSARHE